MDSFYSSTKHKKQLPSVQAQVRAAAADHLPKDDFGIKVDGGGIWFRLIREERPHPPPDLTVPHTDKVPLQWYVYETGAKGTGA